MSEQNPQAEPTWPSDASASGSASDGAVEPAGEQAVASAAATAPTSGYAIAALIVSICSWLVCPIAPAIVALVLAHMADKEIRAGRAAGAGMSTASKIISWVNIGVFVAAFVVLGIILLIVLIADASGGAA